MGLFFDDKCLTNHLYDQTLHVKYNLHYNKMLHIWMMKMRSKIYN